MQSPKRPTRPFDPARRAFVRTSACLPALGMATPFGLNLAAIGAASAQTADDYRALVCVFLAGGNDQYNTVIPLDAAEFDEYVRARPSLALARSEITPLGAVPAQQGRSFGLPKELSPLAKLFQEGRLAILANVGPLVVPTTREQVLNASVPLPPKLFSHNDQQSVWQSSGAEGAMTGWGGRIADLLLDAGASRRFGAISVSGSAVFLSGGSVMQYQLAPSGPVAISGLGDSLFGAGGVANEALRQLVTATQPGLFENELGRVTRRSIDAGAELSAALAASPQVLTAFPDDSPLGAQLQRVARTIAARRALGHRRQVFFVSQGGYDTHDDQRERQAELHAELAQALAAFHQATVELGVADQVTAFTASDFGRTLTSNGDGSDHGWGSHHFILGGAVRGGVQDGPGIFGAFPEVRLGTAQDVGSGRLLPTTSVDQYGATLARWMGLGAADQSVVFPNLAQFTRKDLGFL